MEKSEKSEKIGKIYFLFRISWLAEIALPGLFEGSKWTPRATVTERERAVSGRGSVTAVS